jgi:hypothetical protein
LPPEVREWSRTDELVGEVARIDDAGAFLMTMNPEYFETRFRPARPVATWPAEFVIISAFATTGEAWTPEANESADRRLASDLGVCGVWRERVTGYSPTTGHSEPSWAVELPLDEARAVGLRFHQDAIYHVKDGRLSVTHCDDRRALVDVGSFRSRLDLSAD